MPRKSATELAVVPRLADHHRRITAPDGMTPEETALFKKIVEVPLKPGQSGNPKGRPKGARNRLGTQFLEALETDFNQFGAQAIAQVREKKPEV